MGEDYSFEVWQDGIMVACVSAPSLDAARREALHYAFMYAQDGPVSIKGKHADKIVPALAKETSDG